MSTLEFDVQHGYLGDEIELTVQFPTAPALEVRMTLDTGASISTLNHSLSRQLGISDIESGRPGTMFIAKGGRAPCSIHDLDAVVLERRLTIPVAFCPDWQMKDLLGMRGFMDQLVFAVDHAEHALHLKWR